MALTCSTAFANNTVGVTSRVVQCMKNTDRLGPSELLDDDEKFLAMVLDALERLRIKGTFTLPTLANINACDAETAAYLANCSIADRSLTALNLSTSKLKAAILWQLSQALCS